MEIDTLIQEYKIFSQIYLVSLSLSIKYPYYNVTEIFNTIIEQLNFQFETFYLPITSFLLKDIKIILKTMNIKVNGNKNTLISLLEKNLGEIKTIIINK